MAQHYSNPKRANDAHALPDVETFYRDSCFVLFGSHAQQQRRQPDVAPEGCGKTGKSALSTPAGECEHEGWYWQSCFPGCLPDGEPNGPFATEDDALADAREGVSEDGDDDEADADDPEDDEDENEDDDREDEPDDEDYYLSDDERSIVYLGKFIVGPVSANAEPSPRDAVMRALAAYMKREERDGAGYWPNVWMISDHGNATLISVLDCGCYFTEHDGRPELHEQAAAERMLSESMSKRKGE